MTTSLLIYDIPQSVKVANPTKRLRRIGFRPNASCWVLRDCDIPWLYLNELRTAGVNWHVVPFAAGAGQQLAQMAVHYLTKEVERLTRSLEKSVWMADEELGIGHVSHPEESEQRRHRRRLANSLGRAQKALQDAQRAAEAFGVDLASDSLESAQGALEGLRMRSEIRVAAYVGAMARVDGPLSGMDGVPAEVVADILLDQGRDEEADELREAFS